MQDSQRIKQSVIDRLDYLPQPGLVEVLHFVDFLIERANQVDDKSWGQDKEASLPAPHAFVELAGTWHFEPGELEQILTYIDQCNLAELEEEDALLD